MIATLLPALTLLLAPGPARALGDELDDREVDRKEARLFSTRELRSTLARPGGPEELSIEPGREDAVALAIVEQLRQTAARLGPAVGRLETLPKVYAKLSDLSAVDGERVELRARLLKEQKSFEETIEVLERIKRAKMSRQFEEIGAKGPQANIYADIQAATRITKLGREARDFKFRLRAALQEDEVVYRRRVEALAEERVRRAALRRAAAAGGSGLLLLGGAAGWFLLRRKRSGGSNTPGPGTLVGKNFRLERELGRGGMGIVFEATDTSLRRKVAIKQLRPELKQSPRDLEAFLAEARLVATLKHPHIVEIYAIVNENSDLHLVFELVNGRPLNLELQRIVRAPLPVVVALARQVGSALDHAHANRIIHRDLKPANVMVTPQGTAKVMDFGLAHRASQTIARLTQAATWGTPPYLAPEQELGEVSARSDLYSLGVLLYEALTGRLPFPGPNYLAQKREQPPVPPSELVPGLPKGVDAALTRALDPDPEKRFSSCTELAEALAAAAR